MALVWRIARHYCVAQFVALQANTDAEPEGTKISVGKGLGRRVYLARAEYLPQQSQKRCSRDLEGPTYPR